MLPEHLSELLTAFVDGELSQRQRKAAVRLLERSSEAREVLRQLQENAHKVKQLPRCKLEPSLVDDIARAIAEQKAQPKLPTVKPRRRRWMPYVVASLAASLLIAVIGIAYWQAMLLDAENRTNLAIQPAVQPNKFPPAPEPEIPAPTPKKATNPLLAKITEGTFKDFGQPVVVDPVVVAFTFSDLKKEGAAAGQFTHELNKDRTVQLEITVKNNKLAIDRLQAALQENYIKFAIDPTAKDALKNAKQAKAEYWVYADNLTSDELTKLMHDLSLADTSGQGKSVPSPYEKVTIAPLDPAEKQKLSKKLGVDAKKLELPKDDGSKAKPAERWTRQAVVLPTSSAAQPSAVVRQFMNERRQPQAGTLQILIKIRQE